jgi:hypothetical protein
MEKEFVNGFNSWQETHFEIVSAIAKELLEDSFESKVLEDRHEAQGIGGMWEIAEELTDKFESANIGKLWDGDWFEEIEKFIQKELYK